MSIALPNICGNNLYNFWNLLLTNKLNEQITKHQANFVINLASQEYSSAIHPKQLSKPVINITFKEQQADTYKIIGVHSKKARGVMANFIIRNFIRDPEQLKKFNLNNYQFMDKLSSAGEYVFAR